MRRLGHDTRRGTPVVEFKPVPLAIGPVSDSDLKWLAAHRLTPRAKPAEDAGKLLSDLRDDDSDFTVAEFSSGVASRVRLGEITDSGASVLFAALDAWMMRAARRESLTTGDVGVAISLVRRLDLGLRAPDAINIAIAQRCEAQLLSFDEKLIRCARLLGLTAIHRHCLYQPPAADCATNL